MYGKNLVIVLMVFGLVFSGLSITDVTVSPDPILPGGYGVVTATLSSTQTLSAAGSVISGGEDVNTVTVDVLVYGGIESTEDVLLGDLDAGASTTISIPIKVKPNAESGNYLVKLKAGGWVDLSSGGTQYTEKSATVVVNVLNPPALTLKSVNSIIGEKEQVEILITNNGGTAKNLKLSVSGDFAIENQNEIFVGDVVNETTVSFVLDATEATPGSNDIPFTLEYYNELGEEVTDETTIRLNIVKEDSIVVISQENELISNKLDTLVFKVTNTASKKIEDVKISFPNDDLKLTESEKIKVGSLNAGEEKIVEMEVFAELDPGLNQVETQVEWKENGKEESDTIKLPLTISSDVSVGVYLEAKPSPLKAGEEHTLTVLVSNLGAYTINNVEVEVDSDAFYLMDVQASEYIGELSNDDFSTVQFKIMPTGTGNQNVSIKVTYKDQSGEWKTEDIVKEVIIYGQEQDLGGFFMALGLFAVVAAIVWWFKFRKKDKKTKQ